MKSQSIKGKIHYVFEDKEEFEQHFLRSDGVVPPLVENWRDGKRYDWVVADDEGVVQLLQQKPLPHHGDGKNYKTHKGWCRTVVGTFFQNDKTLMDTDFDKHPNRYRFNSATDAELWKRRRERGNLSNPEWIFVSSLCSGKTLQQSYEESFGPHYNWRNKALFLLKRERIMNKINETVREKLDELFDGDVESYIFKHLKVLIEKSNNPNTILGALRDLGEWHGGKEKAKQITKGEVHVFQPFEGDEVARIEAEEVKTLGEGE